MISVRCVLDYIMHSACMQVIRNPAHLVHSPHQNPAYTRRDPAHRWCRHSRDRSRRT